jgi:hypothetical protein
MNGQVRVLLLLLVVVALHLAACTYTLDDTGDDAGALHGMQVPAPTESINVADAAGLNGTTEVQIFEQAETAIDMEIYLGAITEPDVLESLVVALDVDRPMIAQQECARRYRLVFQLADGSELELSYACQLASPSYLGGSQTFWHERAVIAPDRFNELMAEQLSMMPKLDASRLHHLLPPG